MGKVKERMTKFNDGSDGSETSDDQGGIGVT